MVTSSVLSQYSLFLTWSAEAGAMGRPIETAAMPAAISTRIGRGNLIGTPSLPYVVGTAHCATFQLFACYLSERASPRDR
jgi:hypothetical protein